MDNVEDYLQQWVPIGSKNPELILENLALLDAFSLGHLSETELVARTRAIEQDPAAAIAFAIAYTSIIDKTFDEYRTITLTGAIPSRPFLEWAFVAAGEMRGYLLDKPTHLRGSVQLINHGTQSTCVFAIRDKEVGYYLWDAAVFDLDAPVLALALVAAYCEGCSYDVRARTDTPDYGGMDSLRGSVAARDGVFADPQESAIDGTGVEVDPT